MSGKQRGEIRIRPAREEDDAQVIALLRASLGKQEDPHYDAFLEWKHRQNPFGTSPAWVALDGERIVGFRTFLRWHFRHEDKVLRSVRAVDTATDPDYRGQGIFRRLTLQAVADLTLAGERFVFNTPNDQSRPGYLAMGWTPARRLPVGVLLAGATSVRSMAGSRVPARLWSEATDVGLEASEAFRDSAFAEALLEHAPAVGTYTDRSPAYLAWRTAFAPLAYRVLLSSPSDPAEGGVVFRLRRRGEAVEAAVIELLVPDMRAGVRLVRRLLQETGADYAIGIRSTAPGLVPLPRQGPLLTTRPLAAGPPEADSWRLSLGDVELF